MQCRFQVVRVRVEIAPYVWHGAGAGFIGYFAVRFAIATPHDRNGEPTAMGEVMRPPSQPIQRCCARVAGIGTMR
jgi:hypothetical protein